MITYLMMQMSMNSGDLVKLDISTTKRVMIDFSEYQKVCEHLVANVKYMIDRFTGLVPTMLIEKAIKHEVAGIYAIEKSLLLGIFNKQNHSESTRDAMCIDNLYKLMPIISSVLFESDMNSKTLLTKMIMHDMNSRDVEAVPMNNLMPFLRDSFMQFHKRSGIYMDSPDNSKIQVSTLLFNPSKNASMFSDKQTRFGLIQEFNIIISQYINGLYDAQSKKIYTKAFQSFSSSALIDALNGQSIRDFHSGDNAADVPAFKYHCPQVQTVLSSALAYAMKTLTNRVHPTTGAKIHEIATIQEIAPHMLEKYRMLIPLYLRVCKAFVRRCRVIRKIVGYSKIRAANGVITEVNAGTQSAYFGNSLVRENADDTKLDFASSYANLTNYGEVASIAPLYIDELVNGMSSLIQDIETVQKELLESDSTITLYFDVKKDFTKNYLMSNKDLPFAPLSILAMGYPNVNKIDDTIPLYDVSKISTNKFIYGLRTMLTDDFKITSGKVPYLKKLINDFNGYSTGSNTIDEKKFNDVLRYVGQAANFIYDFRFFNGIAISHVDPLRSFVINNGKVWGGYNWADADEEVLNEARAYITEINNSIDETSPTIDVSTMVEVPAEITNKEQVIEYTTRWYRDDLNKKLTTLMEIQARIQAEINTRRANVAKAIASKQPIVEQQEQQKLELAQINESAKAKDIEQISERMNKFIELYDIPAGPMPAPMLAPAPMPAPIEIGGPGGATSMVPALLTYQEAHPQTAAISIIESVNILDSSNTVAIYIKAKTVDPMDQFKRSKTDTNPRHGVILINIFDLNVMPINVHSLMREIPLANLYNYAMTFDAMVDRLKSSNLIDGFVQKILKTPYRQIQPYDMDGYMENMKTGDLRFINDTLQTKMRNVNHRALSTEAMKARYDTKLVRNLMFITMVQFAIKKKVKNELEFINTRIVTDFASVNNAITDAHTELGAITDNMFEF